MFRLSPFLLAALLVALGLSSCTKKTEEPAPDPAAPPFSQSNPKKEKITSQPPPLDLVDPQILFFNNAESTPLLSLIDDAKSSLDIAIYEMRDSDIIAALHRAISRGVLIRVIHEPAPLGTACNLFVDEPKDKSESCQAERNLRRDILAVTGGSYVPFNKANLCADATKPCFLHGKMVIADSKAVLISTGNFNSSNLCNAAQNPDRCNRDYSMITRDPELTVFFSSIFALDLKGEKYDLGALFNTSIQTKATVSPLSLPPILALIRSANTSIKIENQYLENQDMNDAIFAAAKRGVHVEVTIASLCSFGPPNEKAKEKARELFKAFDEAGVETRMLPSQFEVGGRPGYLHAKSLVVDETNAWVGSVNGSWSAFSNNREFGLIFSEPTAVSALSQVMTSDHASPDMETWMESLECKKDSGTH